MEMSDICIGCGREDGTHDKDCLWPGTMDELKRQRVAGYSYEELAEMSTAQFLRTLKSSTVLQLGGRTFQVIEVDVSNYQPIKMTWPESSTD